MTEPQQHKSGPPWPIIIMLSMLASILILGFVLSPRSEQGKLWWVDLLGTTNYGILLNPVIELSQRDLVTESGEAWSAYENPTFKLVVINRGDCGDACQQMLYSTRQLHVRLNRDYKDVERGFVAVDMTAEQATTAVAEIPDYAILKPGSSALLDGLANTNISNPSDGPILLMINPINVGMMAYTTEHNGSEVLEDLEHLLELAR